MNKTKKRREKKHTTKQALTILFLLPLGQLLQPHQIIEPHVHAQIGLPALNAQRIPRLRLRQQLAHRALRQIQHRLAKQLLTNVVIEQRLLHPVRDLLRIEVTHRRHGRDVIRNNIDLRLELATLHLRVIRVVIIAAVVVAGRDT